MNCRRAFRWLRESRWLVTVLAPLAILPATARSTPPDPTVQGLSPSSRLETLIERVRYEQRRVDTLEADFVQRKESAMLLEPVDAEGVFAYAAPDRVRWDYETPNPISILVTRDAMTTWYRDIQQAERVDVGRHSQRVLEYLGAGSSMDELLEYFSLTLTMPRRPSDPYRLDLDPRFERVAKRLRGMTVWIDSMRFLPVRLRYVEADGDVTDLRFENLRINRGLAEERFDLELPNTVELRRVDVTRATGLR